MPAGPAPDVAGRAARSRPSSSPRRRGLRAGDGPLRRRARRRGPRHGRWRARCRLWAGSQEARRDGFVVEPTARSRSATSRSGGPWRATCCRSPGPATTPPWRRRWPGRHRHCLALAGRAHDPHRGPGPRRSRPPRSPRRRPRRRRRAGRPRARARRCPRTGAGRTAARRRTAAPPITSSSRCGPPRRHSRSGAGLAATAYLEAAIGALDARRDRVRLGLLHERLAQMRRAAGDPDGAMLAARRAVELVPREPSPGTGPVLAGLAQLKMLDGSFSEAQRLAREAIRVARACDPVARDQDVHATTTLGGRAGLGQGSRAAPSSCCARPRRSPGARRSRCAVPDPGQPDDGPRPRRAGGPRRSRSPTEGIEDARRPGSRRSTATSWRQRGRHPLPARPLGGGA